MKPIIGHRLQTAAYRFPNQERAAYLAKQEKNAAKTAKNKAPAKRGPGRPRKV